MPSRRPSLLPVVAALGGLALAGCSNDPYDAPGLREGLVGAGFSQREAACVVDEMEDRFSVDRLSARVPATERQRAAFAAIVEECTAGSPS